MFVDGGVSKYHFASPFFPLDLHILRLIPELFDFRPVAFVWLIDRGGFSGVVVELEPSTGK